MVTGVTLVLLLWLDGGRLRAEAGGLSPLDMRATGYTPEQAAEFVAALSPTGRALYLTDIRWADTALPLLLGLWFTLMLLRLSRGLFSWSRMVLLLPAWGYAVMDLCENALLRDLVRAGAGGFDPAIATLASQFTVTKFVLLAGALAALLFAVKTGQGKDRRA